jgi:hypothetical protein
MRKMICLVSDQGTGCYEAGICEGCDTPANRAYLSDSVANKTDIPDKEHFVDCTGNEAIGCAICGYGSDTK